MFICAGKVINLRRLDEAISSINAWYMERGLFAMVTYPLHHIFPFYPPHSGKSKAFPLFLSRFSSIEFQGHSFTIDCAPTRVMVVVASPL